MKNQNRLFAFLFLVFFLGLQNGTICFAQSKAMEMPEIELLKNKVDSLQKILRESRKEIKSLENRILLKDAQPGEKFAQCFIQTQLETVKSAPYLIYTGEDVEQIGVKKIELEIAEPYGNWVVNRPTEACSNASEKDDLDCIIWEYRLVPARKKILYVVSDTVGIKDFRTQTFDLQRVVKKGSRTRAYQFNCFNYNPDTRLFFSRNSQKIQDALKENGYKLIGAKENVIDKITKSAIVDFQKKNNLPVGKLDYETLKALGVQH
jgi:hypothetical protein